MDEEEAMSDSEIMQYLDDVGKDRFLKLQKTFETDGWALLEEYMQARAFAAGVAGANAKTWEENREALGNRKAWEEAANFAASFMNDFERMAQDNKSALEETYATGYE